MSRTEYYALLKKKHEETNWDDLKAVKEYNEYARMLRKQLENEE